MKVLRKLEEWPTAFVEERFPMGFLLRVALDLLAEAYSTGGKEFATD